MNVFVLAIIGAVLSRFCGEGKIRLPWGLNAPAYAIPYGLIFLGTIWGVPAFLGGVLGKRLGDGQYIKLGNGERQPVENDETVDPLLRFFFGIDKGGAYWRCCAGLAVTGMACSLLAGLFYAILLNPLAGLFLACSGASKAPAYMIGWKMRDIFNIQHPTAWGEALTGAFGWGLIPIIMQMGG